MGGGVGGGEGGVGGGVGGDVGAGVVYIELGGGRNHIIGLYSQCSYNRKCIRENTQKNNIIIIQKLLSCYPKNSN